IDKASPEILEPGRSIVYTLTVSNHDNATGPLTTALLTDCVPDAPHLKVGAIGFDPAHWQLVSSDGTCVPASDPQNNNNGTVGTELKLRYIGPPVAPGASASPVTYQVTANSYTVPVLGSD